MHNLTFNYKDFQIHLVKDFYESRGIGLVKYNIVYYLYDCTSPNHYILPSYEKTPSFNICKCTKALTKQDKRYITFIAKILGYPLIDAYYEG